MKVAIMQPYLFPYIGYWQLINAVDIFVVYDDVKYIKGGFINRNNILVSNKPKLFSISLNKASSNKLINEIMICDDEKNVRKILKTIKESYCKAPYFDTVFPRLKEIFEFNNLNLTTFIVNSIKSICEFLEIETSIVLSSELEKVDGLSGQDRVIDICKKLNSQAYINAIGGQNLYSKNVFKDNNIELSFLKTNEGLRYKQLSDEKFVPNLSIIDVMMFNNKTEVRNLLKEFNLF